MLPIIEQLLVLQDRDRRLLRLKAELDTIPAQRLALQTKAAKTQAAFEEFKKRYGQIESDRRRLELEVDTLKQRISKLLTEQQGTRSNDQYKAYQHQVETTQGEIQKLDDRQLELMEQGEVAAREVQAASKVAAAQKAESDQALADLAAREANMRQEREQAAVERAKLASAIEPGILFRYDRILKNRGETAVVGVHNTVCGGCHMKQPMQTFLEAKAQINVVGCTNCGRILYYTPDMDPRPGMIPE
jgi:predicted  nucleic acid-binding Zn-ribbon protein